MEFDRATDELDFGSRQNKAWVKYIENVDMVSNGERNATLSEEDQNIVFERSKMV